MEQISSVTSLCKACYKNRYRSSFLTTTSVRQVSPRRAGPPAWELGLAGERRQHPQFRIKAALPRPQSGSRPRRQQPPAPRRTQEGGSVLGHKLVDHSEQRRRPPWSSPVEGLQCGGRERGRGGRGGEAVGLWPMSLRVDTSGCSAADEKPDAGLRGDRAGEGGDVSICVGRMWVGEEVRCTRSVAVGAAVQTLIHSCNRGKRRGTGGKGMTARRFVHDFFSRAGREE
jgi:hypothetical protein